jgi:hypothetical protein
MARWKDISEHLLTKSLPPDKAHQQSRMQISGVYDLSYDTQAIQPALEIGCHSQGGAPGLGSTSSAVEGIRAPFSKGKNARAPTSIVAFIAYWKRRVGATAR